MASDTGAAADVFRFEAVPIAGPVRARMVPTSWRDGCPVPLGDLRYLRVSHWSFAGRAELGELVVHADVVDDLRGIFAELFAQRFPIRRMVLVDEYDGSDFESIEADNTSAFNCRPRTGSATEWSQHAYGRAIDINPIENPYVLRSKTSHPASVPFLDRTRVRPGMAIDGGALVAAFESRGWGWGGRWTDPIDHQHFSKNGR